MKFYYLTLSWIYRWYGKKMCKECEGFIKPFSKILDLGCGSGIIAKEFQKHFKSELIGIDIIENLVEKIPFKKFDGEFIPFPPKSFDVVMINFVLHHCRNPLQLLKEAKRVGKEIIVYEDLPEGLLGKLFCKIHGFTFSSIFQKEKNQNFKTEKEWKKIFDKLKLKIIFKKRVANFPVKKQLFILRT